MAIFTIVVNEMHASPKPMANDRQPALVSIVALDGRDDSSLLALAACLAAGLETPLAAALLESARERGIHIAPLDELHRVGGAGAIGSVAGQRVVVGNEALFAVLGLSLQDLGQWPERLRQRGENVLFLAIDGSTAGLLGTVGRSVNGQRMTNVMEDEMVNSSSNTDFFPTDTSNLPAVAATEVVTLADGDRFELRIAPTAKRFGRDMVRMLAYNGSIPGPTLRVQQGAELLVNVVNDGDLETTVHWHGLRLDNRYDGTIETQRPIPVGGAFTYRLTFPDPGVYWYHPHIREDYGQEMGLYGNIVVLPSEPDYWPPAHRELTLAFDDLLLEEAKVAPFARVHPTFTAMGRFGNVLLVNGETEVSLQAKPGEVVRLYLTNTANTRVFNVGLPGTRMKLVGGDSGRCERETFVDSVVIAPSERVVVDALFEQPGQVTLEHRTPTRTYALGTFTVGAERAQPSLVQQFEQLRVDADLEGEHARISGYLKSEPDQTLALVAEMSMGEPELREGQAVAYVCPMHPEVRSSQADRCPKCGMKLVPAHLVTPASAVAHDHAHGHAHHQSHDHQRGGPSLAGIEWEDDMVEVNRMTNPTNMRWKLIDRRTGALGNAIDWRFRVGDRVKIRLINEMDSDHPMHHPFHIHGAGRFLILSRNGAPESNLVWKDTVLVRTGETVDLLLEVTHPGRWMAHCHIAEHHESGMMLSFRVDV